MLGYELTENMHHAALIFFSANIIIKFYTQSNEKKFNINRLQPIENDLRIRAIPQMKRLNMF